MKRILCVVLTLACLTPMVLAESNPFEGRWIVDKKNSPSYSLAPKDLQQQFKFSGPKATVKTTYEQPRNGMYPLFWVGIMVEQFVLNTDGTPTVNPIGPFKHMSTTTLDGNTMTTDWTATIEEGKVEGQWVRKISDDGKSMDMQIKGKCSDGRTADMSLLFHKK